VDVILSKLGVPDTDGRELVSLFSSKELSAGDVLFEYDDVAEAFFFLQKGNLAVHKYTGFLEKMQVIALLDPGTVVGEAALLDRHIRKTRVTAIKDSKLVCLKTKDFEDFRKKFPQSGFILLEYLFSTIALRLEKTSERLARIL
jgi:CRP-like cAMP-binding protein